LVTPEKTLCTKLLVSAMKKKNTKYKKIIKGKSGKYRYIHKVCIDHHSIGATVWFCLDCPNNVSRRKGAIKSFF